jgi:predicted nuclease with TOPRIM domain
MSATSTIFDIIKKLVKKKADIGKRKPIKIQRRIDDDIKRADKLKKSKNNLASDTGHQVYDMLRAEKSKLDSGIRRRVSKTDRRKTKYEDTLPKN